MTIKLCLITLFFIPAFLLRDTSPIGQEPDKDKGVDSENVAFLEIIGTTSDEQRRNLAQTVLKELTRLPEVEAVTIVDALPGSYSQESRVLYAKDLNKQSLAVRYNAITPNYFLVVKQTLLKGRPFIAQDRIGSVPVIIISEKVARAMFPDEDPIGKRVSFSETPKNDSWLEVVGVVNNVEDASGQPSASVYVDYIQTPAQTMNIAIRSKGKSKLPVERLKAEIAALDSQVTVYEVKN